MSLESVLAHWFADYGRAHVVALGEGHIHATYRVEVGEGVFVLQNINEYVFKDGDLVMLQTARLLECWREQSMYVVPELKVTLEGMPSVRVSGALWRVWSYVSGTRVVDPVENITQAQAAGVAFGALQHSLAQLNGARFKTPIEGFLQLPHYLERFSEVAGKAPKELLDIVERHSYLADQLCGVNTHIHGDCKVNNLLFQEASDRVIAVIDFDTAMYGHWAWDFGDLVRSVSHSRGCCDVQYFAACLRGFATH
ncbi:MAG: aminoglycoside phosphotransferase family protein, partial [Gammaproteobacteria bacterium]|nr:aminoglycoside phosphotransferase family protein [Gammaproteobacteria bacterium]